MYTFGFIGCGNMGGALAVAVSKTEKNIAVADRSEKACENIAGITGAAVATNGDIAEKARYIVLGVKPQVLSEVMSELAPVLKKRKDPYTLISMAAGVKIEKITDLLTLQAPVIRIMPNMPASVGEGMIVYSVNGLVSDGEKADFEKAFSAAGEISFIPEKLIDAASAVSGCGPAFVYMFIEALADGGVRCGLPRALAQKLAAKTVGGSADTVLISKKHPGELKDAVCSPAGSTIEGVAALENNAFRGAVAEAVAAAYERTKELGN
ncbi:MAG: pyrroline-5-carboxylate reductase [Clostridia bacterium]|nr:pyrroline-5-carboxylate reductase [Clostridia bacterium]